MTTGCPSMNRARESMWKKSVYISPSPKTREKFSDVGVREMKRAYLFGGAALLILLIVVAYFSSTRNEVDAPVVGPIAPPEVVDGDPTVRKLLLDDVGSDEEETKPKPIGGPKPLDPRLQLRFARVMEEIQARPRFSDENIGIDDIGDIGALLNPIRETILECLPIGENASTREFREKAAAGRARYREKADENRARHRAAEADRARSDWHERYIEY